MNQTQDISLSLKITASCNIFICAHLCRKILFLATAATARLKACGSLTMVTFFKKETQHMLFDQLEILRVSRIKTIFINDGSQSLQPLLPAFFRDVFKNAYTQVTRMWWCVETGRICFTSPTQVGHKAAAQIYVAAQSRSWSWSTRTARLPVTETSL